jgi:hypothetical protein
VWNNRLSGAFENCPALREIIISEKQKEELFIDRHSRWISMSSAVVVFERIDTDGDTTLKTAGLFRRLQRWLNSTAMIGIL